MKTFDGKVRNQPHHTEGDMVAGAMEQGTLLAVVPMHRVLVKEEDSQGVRAQVEEMLCHHRTGSKGRFQTILNYLIQNH